MRLEIGKPNIKQDAFLRDSHRHVGYGGARGGGKSWSIRTKAKILATSYPGIRILIVRRTYPELMENHITPLKKDVVDNPKCRIAKYNSTEKKITFHNGSVIKFAYCKNDADLGQFQGQEYDIIFFDEATQLTENQMKEIAACNRGVNNYPKRIYYTCNPGGQGHAYIKRIFVDRKYKDGENPEDYSFIQALVYDNKILMEKQPEYIKNLEALPPKKRKAWLDGDWDVFEGQFFEEFTDDPNHYQDHLWTHVIEPFDIPGSWKIYRSYDFGYNKPFSIGWWAISQDGVLYRILEWYGCVKDEPNTGLRIDANAQFSRIAEIEKEHPYLKGKTIIGTADPAIWNKESGESVAEIAARHGIYFDKGKNDRINGWMQMHYRMTFDENGRPLMYVFNTCKNFIRTIPLLQYDENKVEDLDTDGEDHIADETRYLCMMHVISPRRARPIVEITDDPLNQRVKKSNSIVIG